MKKISIALLIAIVLISLRTSYIGLMNPEYTRTFLFYYECRTETLLSVVLLLILSYTIYKEEK